MKKVIAASLNKLLRFDSVEEFEKHIEHLKDRKREYAILSRQEFEDGAIRVLIKEQYNDNLLL